MGNRRAAKRAAVVRALVEIVVVTSPPSWADDARSAIHR
jgi:hypothetical protein